MVPLIVKSTTNNSKPAQASFPTSPIARQNKSLQNKSWYYHSVQLGAVHLFTHPSLYLSINVCDPVALVWTK